MASILACLKSLNTCVLGSVLFTQWCELPRAVEMYYMENGGLFIYGSIQCVSVVTLTECAVPCVSDDLAVWHESILEFITSSVTDQLNFVAGIH